MILLAYVSHLKYVYGKGDWGWIVNRMLSHIATVVVMVNTKNKALLCWVFIGESNLDMALNAFKMQKSLFSLIMTRHRSSVHRGECFM